MISLFGASYGILQPLLLLVGVPSILLLIYAYKRKGKGRPVPVATLLLLRQLKRQNQAKDKFNPPLRFLLELLILLLLSLALAGLFTSQEGDKIAVLIDNSFGTSAIAPGGDGRQTLLMEITNRAVTVIDSLQSNASFHLYKTSPNLSLVQDEFIGHDETIATVQQIQSEFAADHLQSAIDTLKQRGSYKRVLIFSDKQQRTLEVGNQADNRVRLYSVTGTEALRQNVAISHVSLQGTANPPNPNTGTLSVALDAYTTTPVEVRVSIYPASGSNETTRPIRSTSTSLIPGTTAQVRFEGLSTSSYYRIELSLESTEEARTLDHIEADNFAWISGENSSDTLLLVSDLKPEELGLNRIRARKWLHLTPDAYENASSEQKNRPAIFHRYTPAELPEENALFIYPAKDNLLFPTLRSIRAAEITRWLSSHPLTSYLNVPALQLPSAAELDPPYWMQPLISSTKGAVALVGELEGKKYVLLGFEILPFQGKKSPLLSVLTMNALSWLGNTQENTGYQSIFAPLSKGELKYLDTLPNFEGSKFIQTGTPRLPGLLSVTTEEKGELRRALNFFDHSESDLRKSKYVDVAESQSTEMSAEDRQILYQRLALIAFILVLLDLLFDLFPLLWRALGRKSTSPSLPRAANV